MKNNEPYPYNLLCDIYAHDGQLPEQLQILDRDQEKGLTYVLSTLTDRERGVICEYYLNDKTLEEIGKEYNVTRERIRQVLAKALRKLRHHSRSNYIIRGYEIASGELERRVKARHQDEIDRLEREFANSFEALKCIIDSNSVDIDSNVIHMLPIEDMGLSTRTFYCLKHRGIKSMYELCEMTESDLQRVRNLGRKSMQEIVDKMAEHGLKLKQ